MSAGTVIWREFARLCKHGNFFEILLFRPWANNFNGFWHFYQGGWDREGLCMRRREFGFLSFSICSMFDFFNLYNFENRDDVPHNFGVLKKANKRPPAFFCKWSGWKSP